MLKTIFRYPGGKQKVAKKLVPLFDLSHGSFHDVCVGGGSVLCRVAKENPTLPLFANDLDPLISNFWKLFERENKNLWEDFFLLLSQKPTITLFNHLKSKKPTTQVEKAYYALFFNKTTFSGIQRGSPIGGQRQKSKWTIDCRYNFENLRSNINFWREIFVDRLQVFHLDMIGYLKNHESGFFYIDPPYYQKGKMLYTFYPDVGGHQKLAEILKNKKNWLLSYDDCMEIRSMYSWAKISSLEIDYSINGKKEKHKKTAELIIVS